MVFCIDKVDNCGFAQLPHAMTCLGCLAYYTDLACSDQFLTLKFDSPIFQYFNEVLKVSSGSTSMIESLILEILSASKSYKCSLHLVLMVTSWLLIL